VEETDDRGRDAHSTEARARARHFRKFNPSHHAAILLRRFVLGWKVLGLERSLGSRSVTYADYLVICVEGKAEEGLATTARSWQD